MYQKRGRPPKKQESDVFVAKSDDQDQAIEGEQSRVTEHYEYDQYIKNASPEDLTEIMREAFQSVGTLPEPLYPEREPVYCYTWDIPNSNCPIYTMHITVPVLSCESVEHAVTAALAFRVPLGDKPEDGSRALNEIERQWVKSKEPKIERETQNIPLRLEVALNENQTLREENRAYDQSKRVFEAEGIDPTNPNAWRLGVLGQAQDIVIDKEADIALQKRSLYDQLQDAVTKLQAVAESTGWAPPPPVVNPPDYGPLTIVSPMSESQFFVQYPELHTAKYSQRIPGRVPTEQEMYGLKMIYGTNPHAISIPHHVRMKAGAGDVEMEAYGAAVEFLREVIGED